MRGDADAAGKGGEGDNAETDRTVCTDGKGGREDERDGMNGNEQGGEKHNGLHKGAVPDIIVMSSLRFGLQPICFSFLRSLDSGHSMRQRCKFFITVILRPSA